MATQLGEANIATAQIASITDHTEGNLEDIIGRYKVRTRKQAARAYVRRLAADAERPGNK